MNTGSGESTHDPEASVSDRDLLAAHVNGDPDAFGTLFLRHRDRLWAVALRTLGDPDQAADALQEAMIAAVRRADTFRGDAQVTTWLHRIVVNACIDAARRAKVRAADPLPDDVDRMPALADTACTDPVDRLAERDEVQTALATLPEEQRAALVLVDMEGYPVAEAAVILDCPQGTVKSRCARGRARLAPLLRHVWNPDQAPSVPPGSDRPEAASPAAADSPSPPGGERS